MQIQLINCEKITDFLPLIFIFYFFPQFEWPFSILGWQWHRNNEQHSALQMGIWRRGIWACVRRS